MRKYREYELLSQLDESIENQFVIIVGKNGEGKSRLLLDLCHGPFDRITKYKNVIAVSTSPFDRFPLRIRGSYNKNKLSYSYVGVRSSAGSNSALSLISSASLGFLKNHFKENKYIFRLKHILRDLGFSNDIEYVLKVLVTPDKYKDYKDSFNEQEYLGNGSLDLHERNNVNVQKALFALNMLADNNGNLKIKLIVGEGVYLDDNQFMDYELVDAFQTLINMKFIKLIDLRVNKFSYGKMSLRFASSGEQCVLLSFIGIAANISDNSLILIDEPEISLHPEWQEKYISLLVSCFKNYNRCDFIIATHSPQLISRLTYGNCLIYNMNGIVSNADDYINRSIDFQLAKVFGKPGFKNEFLTRKFLTFLSNVGSGSQIDDAELKEIKDLVKLKGDVSQNDPVHKLISLSEATIAKLTSE